MAEYDDTAFGYMNEVDPDQDITGGAIDYSRYDMEFSPEQQGQYKQSLVNAFDSAYQDEAALLNIKDISDTLERSGLLKSLFTMHTGRLEDARKLVEHLAPNQQSNIGNRPPRR